MNIKWIKKITIVVIFFLTAFFYNTAQAAPLTTAQAVATATLSKNVSATPFTPVTAAGGMIPYAFSISPALPAGLSIGALTGTISGTPTVTSPVTTYTVTATDLFNQTSSKTFNLSVSIPALTSTQAVLSVNLIQGLSITAFLPMTVSGGAPPYTYSVNTALPSGISIGTSSGLILGLPLVTSSVTVYTITATDLNGQTTSQTLSIGIGAALATTQAVANTVLTKDTATVPFIPVTATGGAAPYSFAVSPSLPTGLSFNTSTGQVTGTPTAITANTTYTVTVTDSVNVTSSKTFNLTVNPSTLVTTQSIPTTILTKDTAATSFIPVTGSGGTTPYTFSISPSLPTGLSLNASTGQITGTPTVTSVATVYTITITDAGSQTSSKTFSLTINPSALVTVQAIASTSLIHNTTATAFIPITTSGGSPPYSFAVSPSLPAGLSFNTTTGQITGTPTAITANATYTVTVTDSASITSSKTFTLKVDPAALVTTQAVASTTLTHNAVATAFIPVTVAGGTAPYSFAVSPSLPAGLSFNAATGQITGTPTAITTNSTYTVTVTDTANVTSSKTFDLVVNAAALVTTQAVTSTTLTHNAAATAFIPVTVAGGTVPYTFAVSPSLPAGLSFNAATGQVTGTPTVITANATYTVTVTDAASITSSKTFTLKVDPAALITTQAVASTTLTHNAVATAFIPVSVAGGTVPYTFAVSPSLPAGLSFNTATGQITGTPTAITANATYTVTITDAASVTSSKTFDLVVNAAALVTTQAVASTTLTHNAVATAFIPVTVAGGTAPYSFAVSPSLPAGLSFNAATGQITGTPTVISAAATYTVTVTDTASITSSKTFTLKVDPAALITTQAVASTTLTHNAAATAFIPVTVAGGTAPYSFAVSPSLPAGLSFNAATGQVTGTPTVITANATYTVTVTDTANVTSSKTFDLAVNAAALITTQAVASITLTHNVAATAFIPVTVAGGTVPYSFAVSPSLPSGLSFNTTTGQITGTPTAITANATYTVTITDAASVTSSKVFDLEVNPSALITVQAIASTTLTHNAAATAFIPVTVAGGTAPYSFAVSPSLPAGLSLNTTTGQITGTPTAITANATYTVTVTDAASITSSKTFTLKVDPAALITTQAVASTTLTHNAAATAFIPVTVAGGTAPYTFAVSPSLPVGLSFNAATGQITGTPTAITANATYTVIVTDAASVTSSKVFDLEVNPSALITVQAVASTTLTHNAAATAFIPVTVAGGTAPYSFAVSPSLPAGLSFNTATGQITGTPTAITATATYTVIVTDAASVTSSKVFDLEVNPSALITVQAVASTTLTHNAAATAFIPVTVTGGTVPYTFAVSPSLPSGLNFNTTTGQITGTPTVISPTATYTVTATDAASVTSSATFSLTVDPATLITTQAIASTTLTQNVAATAFIPVTVAGGTVPYSFAVSPSLPAGLSFNTATGQITGTPTAITTNSTYTVTVTDTANVTSSKTFDLVVNAAALVTTQAVASTTLTHNAAATAFIPVTVAGGTVPYSFAVSPSLPAGLSFNAATGQITGTPTVITANATYTVTVTDTASITSSKTFDLEVEAAALIPTQATVIPVLVQNMAVTPFTPIIVSGGTGPYSYTISPGLPAGLTFNSATSEISGTPTTITSATTYTVNVTDSANVTSSATFSLTVDPVTLITTQAIASTTLTQNVAATAFIPVTVAGGTAPYTFAVSPSLPAGLSFNTATGQITGTPTAITANATYTVTVTDAASVISSKNFDLEVPAAVIIPTPANNIPTLTQNTPVTPFTPIVISGGTSPYTYAISPSLPAGLTFNPATGEISGTPTTITATTTYTVNVTDSANVTSSATFSLTVDPATLITTQAVASTTLTHNVTATAFIPVTVAGGTAPYTFAVSPSLPAGLSFNTATGQITGTPTAITANATYTVTVTDAASVTSSKTFNLRVLTSLPSQLITIQVVAATTLTQNVTITPFTPIIASGGSLPYHFSINPNLPAGLNFNTTNGEISGSSNIAHGLTLYTVTVTDSGNQTSNNSFALSINSASNLTIKPDKLLALRKTDKYSQQLSVIGGTAPYQFVVTGGSLPPGISLSQNGLLEGKIKDELEYHFTITVTDALGATGIQIYSMQNIAIISPEKDQTIEQNISAQASIVHIFTQEQTNMISKHLDQLKNNFSSPSSQHTLKINADFLPYQLNIKTSNLDIKGLWIEGEINYKKLNLIDTRYKISTDGLCIGIDKIINKNFIAGTALGFADMNIHVAQNQAKTKGKGIYGSTYGKAKLKNNMFIEYAFGYGDTALKNTRRQSTDQGLLTGKRTAMSYFGSVDTRVSLQKAKIQIDPFLRADFNLSKLNGYSEYGDSLLALKYHSTKMIYSLLSNGANIAISKVSPKGGVTSTFGKLYYTRATNHSKAQSLYEMNFPDTVYYIPTNIILPPNSVTAQIGLNYQTRSKLISEITFGLSKGDKSYFEKSINANAIIYFG